MTTSSPETQLTADHLRIWSLMATVFEPVNSDQSRRMEEIESLLRSLVGPEATHVLVEIESLKQVRNDVEEEADTWQAKLLHNAVENMNRWLGLSVSTPAPQHQKDAETRAYDLRETADDLEQASFRSTPGVAQILRERAARLRDWADEIGPDTRSFTTTADSPAPREEPND